MVLDFVGKQIAVGCRLAYPMRRGAQMWLSTMKVDQIEELPGGEIVIKGHTGEGRKTRTKNVQNCVVLA
jgi:hypothetical protein